MHLSLSTQAVSPSTPLLQLSCTPLGSHASQFENLCTRARSTHLLHMWERTQGFSWTINKKRGEWFFSNITSTLCAKMKMRYIAVNIYWLVKCWTHLFAGGRRFKAVILQQMSAGWLCSLRRGRAWTRRLQGKNKEWGQKAEYNLWIEILKSEPSTTCWRRLC